MSVLEQVITSKDREDILRELELLSANSDDTTIKKLVTETTSPYKSLLLEICNGNDLRKEIQSAISELKTVQELQITAARKLPIELLSKIKDWFVTHVGRQTVIDVSHDPSLIAGIQITYNGKYFDGSASGAISGYMSKSRMRTLLFKK